MLFHSFIFDKSSHVRSVVNVKRSRSGAGQDSRARQDNTRQGKREMIKDYEKEYLAAEFTYE